MCWHNIFAILLNSTKFEKNIISASISLIQNKFLIPNVLKKCYEACFFLLGSFVLATFTEKVNCGGEGGVGLNMEIA